MAKSYSRMWLGISCRQVIKFFEFSVFLLRSLLAKTWHFWESCCRCCLLFQKKKKKNSLVGQSTQNKQTKTNALASSEQVIKQYLNISSDYMDLQQFFGTWIYTCMTITKFLAPTCYKGAHKYLRKENVLLPAVGVNIITARFANHLWCLYMQIGLWLWFSKPYARRHL